jgi:uncharacterized protein (TIGR02118 family)
MIKHISIVSGKPGSSPLEFRRYWEETHAQIVKTRLPGLRKYVANFPIPIGGNGPALGSGAQIVCSAIVELHFDTVADLQAAMAGPGWQSPERKNSSDHLMDYSKHQYVIVEEVVVPLSS